MQLNEGVPFQFADLQGRTIILTGAASGIGCGLLPSLMAQGLNLILIDRSTEQLESVVQQCRAAGSQVEGVVCDLSEPLSRANLIEQIKSLTTSLDGIIHNAGVDPRMPLETTTLDFFRQVMATNVEPALELTRDLLPLLRQSCAGRVLLIGSITFDLGASYLSAYVASKGAVVGLTRSLAHELGVDGITINCIAPGAVALEKDNSVSDGNAEANSRKGIILENQSLQRRIVPQDLAGLVCLLLSEAGVAISGQTISVDGGLMHPIASTSAQSRLVKIASN